MVLVMAMFINLLQIRDVDSHNYLHLDQYAQMLEESYKYIIMFVMNKLNFIIYIWMTSILMKSSKRGESCFSQVFETTKF